jgi:hypothetical protein
LVVSDEEDNGDWQVLSTSMFSDNGESASTSEVQEQAQSFDEEILIWATELALLSDMGFSDPNESENKGNIAVTKYGKGQFIYTGLVFFREIPAGVPGAYRLLANLLAKPN